MRWEEERYVRLYTRDTAAWMALGWEAQALFMLILRKVDRVGVLDLGRTGDRGLASLAGMPIEVVGRALPILLDDGCIERVGASLIVKNYVEAQEASMSPAMRQKESRLRQRDMIRSGLDPKQRATVIYFLQSEHGGPVKIGMSDDVAKRIVGLQTSRPDKLVLLGAFPGTVADERMIHQKFAHLREKGEWFSPDKELLSFVVERCNGSDAHAGVTKRDTDHSVTCHKTSDVTLSRTVPSVPSDPNKEEIQTPFSKSAPEPTGSASCPDDSEAPPNQPPTVAPGDEPPTSHYAQEPRHEAISALDDPEPVDHHQSPAKAPQRHGNGQPTLFALTGPQPGQPEPPRESPHDPAQEIFDEYLAHWRRTVGARRAPVLDEKRRKLVKGRIRDGFTVDELKRACAGVWRSSWHVEQKQCDFSLVMRDASHVERFMALAPVAKAPVFSVPARPALDPEIAATQIPESARTAAGAPAFLRTVLENLGETGLN